MADITQSLHHLREDIDTLIAWGWSPENPTIDILVRDLHLTEIQSPHANQFITEYYLLAEKSMQINTAFEAKIKEVGTRDKGSYPRLVYNSLVPAASLGLVTSSMGGAVLGLLAGFSVDLLSQTYWKNAASPAKVGWWTFAGGVVGAAIDYFADTSMPFFTYIIPAASGTLSALVEANKAVHRHTPETLRESQIEIRAHRRKIGDDMVKKYARIMSECK